MTVDTVQQAAQRDSDDDLLIRLAHAGCGANGKPLIEDVDLGIRRREWVGVVGPPGAGKTTLLQVALGRVAPTYGAVIRSPGLRAVYVPQAASIVARPPSTAEAALAQGIKHRAWRRWTASDRLILTDTLDRLGLGRGARRPLDWLSGTDRQRILIGWAMIRRPDLLVLDEPTAGTDPSWSGELLAMLAELHVTGQTILLATDDLGIAASVPRLVCFNRTVVADGPPAEVLHPYVFERTFGTATPGARRR